MCQSDRPFEALTAHTGDHEGVAVVVLTGEVDMMTEATGLNEALMALDRAPAGLVLDLRAVGFFGSSGINMLLTVQKYAQAQDAPLVVVAAHHVVLSPLAATGVEVYFRLFPDLPAALRALARHGLVSREAVRGTA